MSGQDFVGWDDDLGVDALLGEYTDDYDFYMPDNIVCGITEERK